MNFRKLGKALRQIAIIADLQNEFLLSERALRPSIIIDEDDLPKSERKRRHHEEFLRGQA